MRLALLFLASLAACAPAARPVRAFTVDHFAAAAEPRGCARLVVFQLHDVARDRRAPASLCLETIPDAPEGTWFWIDGRVEADLPDGRLVVAQRIRANDFDPEGTGRAMRVALWDGRVDPARSTGAFRGRAGRLHGGGKLYFDIEKGARAEVVLVLDLR
jgi:hypothetical protein